MRDDFKPELEGVLGRLILLRPSSRDHMKQQVSAILGDKLVQVHDTHNTTSVIFRFTADGTQYGIKIEYGAAQVSRDEAHWYELAPAHLKTHFMTSHIADDYAFIILRWLDKAKTIEQIAIENEGNTANPTIELVLAALAQNKELFDSNISVPLPQGQGLDYFYEKYRAYNAKAVEFPYLQQLLTSETIRVNDRTLPGPERFVQAVLNKQKLREYLAPHMAGLIHGDSHMDNLLVEEGRVYFIDPKGVDHLPLEYDTGRVLWSLTGWNAIVNGEFTLQSSSDGYELTVAKRQQYVDGMPRIYGYFSEQEYHRALYSSAMQYLTRVSHAAVEPEATALYLRGLELFADLFDNLGEKV